MIKESQLRGLRVHSRESNELVRECLKTAMVQLSHTMDYKDISVTALCRKAGVSRMAFYRNYAVTEDVLQELAEELNQKIVDAVGSPFRPGTTKGWYVTAFQIIAAHREEMTLMFQENFQHRWMKTVNSIVLHDDRFSTDKKLQRILWAGGFENAVAWWLNGGMVQSPEEMAEVCIRCLPHLLNENV